MKKTILKAAGGAAIIAMIITAGAFQQKLNAAPEDKVTICHAAGQAGTTHYVELTISRNAVFGEGGHFFENGTPRAGHEQDYLGRCKCKTEQELEPR